METKYNKTGVLIDIDEMSNLSIFEEDMNVVKYNEFNDIILKFTNLPSQNRVIVPIQCNLLYKYRDIICNSRFNREISEERINNLGKEFNPAYSNAIVLANRVDKKCYEVLDGQHRLTYILDKRNIDRFGI